MTAQNDIVYNDGRSVGDAEFEAGKFHITIAMARLCEGRTWSVNQVGGAVYRLPALAIRSYDHGCGNIRGEPRGDRFGCAYGACGY